ncbi:hypothetical protein FJ250_13500, partial [bacterium]|nr:hypothetical protein [bacterium]
RDHDGRCDKCERRERRERRECRHDRHDRRDDCCEGRHDRGRRHDRAGFAACDHSERCGACRVVEVGGCREHRGMIWVAGHYERIPAGRGRGNRVWVPGHWERAMIACR